MQPKPRAAQIVLWRKAIQYQLQEMLKEENSKDYVASRKNWIKVQPEDILKNHLLKTDASYRDLASDEGFYVPGEELTRGSTRRPYRLPFITDLIDCSDVNRYLIPLAGINLARSRTLNWQNHMLFHPEFRKQYGTFNIIGDGNCCFR